MIPTARDKPDSLSRKSITSPTMPRRASSTAVVKPAGPAPTINTFIIAR